MNANLILRSRLLLNAAILTALLSLAALYAPVALQELAGITTTPAVYACGPQTGGGDC